MLLVIVNPEAIPNEELEGFPSSAADIPLSHVGALYLFAALQASSALFGVSVSVPKCSIFPEHAGILKTFIGGEDMSGIGAEKDVIVDAVLSLGYVALSQELVVPDDPTEFTTYLQRLSLLSANTPSPTLRFQAYNLTSSVLHAHPSDRVRLDFIRDTLEHCPYQNLKVAAVGWLKDEIVAAPEVKASLFRSSTTMTALAPFIFTDLVVSEDNMEVHKADLTFYLAALNFLYLICSSPTTINDLEMYPFLQTHNIDSSFIAPLEEVCRLLDAGIYSDEQDEEGQEREPFRESFLLADAIDRARGALKSVLDTGNR